MEILLHMWCAFYTKLLIYDYKSCKKQWAQGQSQVPLIPSTQKLRMQTTIWATPKVHPHISRPTPKPRRAPLLNMPVELCCRVLAPRQVFTAGWPWLSSGAEQLISLLSQWDLAGTVILTLPCRRAQSQLLLQAWPRAWAQQWGFDWICSNGSFPWHSMNCFWISPTFY